MKTVAGWRERPCRIKPCRKHVAVKKHDLCVAHYSRLQRTGTVGGAELRPRRNLRPFVGR